MYDAALGRFFTQDLFAEKYIGLTPYQYAANNPISFIDVNGDSIAIFGNDGQYIMTLDDGKEELSGLYMQNKKVKRNKDGSTTTTYSNGVAFAFNDPEIDAKAIQNEAIDEVTFMSNEQIDGMMEESDVNKSYLVPEAFALFESTDKMDYGINGYKQGALKKSSFYIIDGVAYNIADFGNFLWGQGMSRLRIPLAEAKIGAHLNNRFRGNSQQPALYNFGHGTNVPYQSLWDSEADQRAIVAGYKYKTGYKTSLEKSLDNFYGTK